MLEIVGTLCWLASTSRYKYLLASKLEVDQQLCLAKLFFFFFPLTVLYSSYIQDQAPHLYDFTEFHRGLPATTFP